MRERKKYVKELHKVAETIWRRQATKLAVGISQTSSITLRNHGFAKAMFCLAVQPTVQN
jgi:hypothetical protein